MTYPSREKKKDIHEKTNYVASFVRRLNFTTSATPTASTLLKKKKKTQLSIYTSHFIEIIYISLISIILYIYNLS